MFSFMIVFSRETKASQENRDSQEREVLASQVQRYECSSSPTDTPHIISDNDCCCFFKSMLSTPTNTRLRCPSCAQGELGSAGLAGVPGMPGEDGGPGQKVRLPLRCGSRHSTLQEPCSLAHNQTDPKSSITKASQMITRICPTASRAAWTPV